MKSVLFLIFFICVAKIQAESISSKTYVKECSSDWMRYGNTKCFKLITRGTTISHIKAEEDCNARGAHLASVHSADEHRFLKDYVLKEIAYEKLMETWLGGRRVGKTDFTWIWTDLSPFDYARWVPGDPSNNEATGFLTMATSTWNYENRYKFYGAFANVGVAFHSCHNFICQKMLIQPSCECLKSNCECERKLEK